MRKMKSIIATILLAIIMATMSGCGEIKKAESVVNNTFSALKNLDFEELKTYVDLGEEDDELTKALGEAVFDELDYKIISSEKTDSKNVIVKTEVTAVDMKPVMQEFMTKALSEAFSSALSGDELSDEDLNKKMEEFLVECASKPDLEKVTNEVDIKVTKNDNNEWEIVTDDTFLNAVLGGMVDAINELNESFESVEE